MLMETTKKPLPMLTDEALFLARDIEICIGPFQQSDQRAQAMENLLMAILRAQPDKLRDLVVAAADVASVKL